MSSSLDSGHLQPVPDRSVAHIFREAFLHHHKHRSGGVSDSFPVMCEGKDDFISCSTSVRRRREEESAATFRVMVTSDSSFQEMQLCV